MMKSPFRKLVRIAIVLLAAVLLFNFFGYYLIHLGTVQDEKMVQLVNIGGYQRTLSQMITKDVLLLTNRSPHEPDEQSIREQLKYSIDTFVIHNQFLREKINLLHDEPASTDLLEITRQLTNSQTHFKSLVAVAQEVLQADSQLLAINGQLYSRQIQYSEKKYFTLINEIVQRYTDLITGKIKESSNINT